MPGLEFLGRSRIEQIQSAIAALGLERVEPPVISDDLGIPSLSVFAARGDVLRDDAKSQALTDFLNRVRLHWTWYAANLPAVERFLIEKLKQTPKRRNTARPSFVRWMMTLCGGNSALRMCCSNPRTSQGRSM
jgi:hypothetical protein